MLKRAMGSNGSGPLDPPKILLAGPRDSAFRRVHGALRRAGFEVTEPVEGAAAWESFQERPFDLVVTALHVPELGGLELLRRIRSTRSRDARAPVFLIASDCTLSVAAAAGRCGVTDCFPLDKGGIQALVASVCAIRAAAPLPLPYVLRGSTPAVSSARERVRALAGLATPVLISGERGTGHGQVVSYLHRSGVLASAPLYRIDCTAQSAAIPSAESATWCLEEIHDLTAESQAIWQQLLAASERGRSRVLASSTRDLRALATQRRFSSELARDLCQFEVQLPPLRDRRDDLPKLIHAVLEIVGERIGRASIGIAANAIERLCNYSWWENFTELESALESLAAFAPGGEITESAAELVILDSDPVARAARERRRSEREELLRLVEECGGNLTRIAAQLKVDRGTVRYRLRKHGLLPHGLGQDAGPE